MLLHHMPYLICLSFYIGVIELELFSSLDDEINPIEQKKTIHMNNNTHAKMKL